MKRLLATATTIALVAIGAVATTARADEEPSRARAAAPLDKESGPIKWEPCTEPNLKMHKAECGFLTVPIDYRRPAGGTLQLAVSRIRHTVPDKQYQGVMLANPGGPGGAGRGLAVIGSLVPNGAGAAYDWIGFDPRGVGASKPALTCDSDYTGYDRPPYVPTSAQRETAWLNKARGYAVACAKAGGPLLGHLKTVDTVRDMDSLREALGADRINYYGFSYGTYLGQVYATMYPERVRRMVLDGNVDPTRVWYDSNLDQDYAFNRNIKIYFGWIAKYDKVYHLGRTERAVERLFYAEQAKLIAKPAGGVIGPDELTDVFLQPGYYIFGWQDVANAFSAWVNKHDPAPLKSLYDTNNPQKPGADNNYAIYLAVQCSDVKWPGAWSKWQSDNWAMHRRAPFETWANAWYNAPCREWPAAPGAPVTVNGAGAPPILLLSESLDAATPFTGSLEVRKRFPRAALVEGVGGTTHAGSLFGNKCVDDTVADYLATGVLPKRAKGDRSDKRCTPLAQPDPTKPAAKRAVPAARLALEQALS
jgi:pimeloyl-ACP methyl ester carboxylesterase